MAQGLEQRVAAVRRFSRFYTQQIGLLHEGYLDSPFNLAQSRVLYELAHWGTTTASELSADLALDAGYLSRILRGFEKQGFLTRAPAPNDRRQNLITLSEAGYVAFAPLNRRSREDIGTMLRKLPGAEQKRLVEAMETIEGLLGAVPERRAPWLMRPHRPGDWGWIVSRHGAVYAEEYGFDETFEALVAEIVAGIIKNFDPAREHCWIAEQDGENVGSVILVRRTKAVAKLRLLIVEKRARGLGIGRRLVEECLRFARAAGYRKVTLWTQSILVEARHLYEDAGFRLVAEEKNRSFGVDLVSETWELDL
jgi:DNA-binding MarR family transcriptional regulator/GNAT superfamily N-acetyltransferase